MSELVASINQAAAEKRAAEKREAAERKAKAEAPPKEVVNIRHVKRGDGKNQPGSFLFPATPDHAGFELFPGDNVIDAALITPAVQAQLLDWINAGWIDVTEVSQ